MSPAGARSNSMPSVGSLSPSQEVTPTTLWCSVAAGGAKRPAAGTRMASKRSSGGVPVVDQAVAAGRARRSESSRVRTWE
jgi:hypothetical protein